MKRLTYGIFLTVTALLVFSEVTIQAQTLVDQWGSTSQGRNWPILNDANTPAGNASMAGPNPIPGNGWATIRGEFNPLTATTSQAVVVTGKIQFVGATGGGSTYTPLRYALTYHQNDTLNNALTSTAAWVRALGSGYQFMPRSGAGTVANGVWGSGTVGVLNNGNWNSTNSNNGPALATILQAPRNAELIPGTYNFAFSVQAVNDTTNEIRWYLVEEGNRYWFGGAVTGPVSTTTFNGVCFGVNTGGWTQVNLTGVTAGLGAPITVPEAPWEAYYIDQWGTTPQGRYFRITNDANTLIGDASIVGTAPINGAGQATVRGGFGQNLPIKSNEALIVSGELELVGTVGAGSTYNPLRFALAYHPNDTLRYALTDSARWVRAPGYGYIWCPRTGAGTVANGVWGSGTVGVLNNGNWNSTNSNGGPALATILQAPRNAQMIPSTYKWAISVQAVNDTTNEIRWYLIEKDTKYWFGGVINGPAVTDQLNAINFCVNTGDWTAVNVIAAQVDYGTPLTVPAAPFEAYYLDQWGRTTEGFGNAWPRGMLNDANTPVGNASIAGVQPMPAGTNGASLRGGFGQDIAIPSDKALIVKGQLEYVGGGMGSVYTPLRYAITYLDSLTLRYQYTDSAQWASTRSDGSQNHHYGYEFTPRSGTGTQPNGAGGSGSVWGIRNGNWASTFSNGGGIIGPVVNQAPRNAEISEGTYDWAISVQAVNDTTNEVRWYLVKTDNSYWFGGSVMAPALTDKFNGIAFWFRDGAVTQFNIFDAQVDLGDPIDIPAAPFEAYYLDQWGRTTEGFGNAWPRGMLNDANTPVGNASIAGVQPMPAGTNGASLRGGFGQDIAIPSDKALIVKGQLEYVGGGMGSVYTPLRYAITYLDSLTLRYQYTDSAQWASTRSDGSQNHHYGYEFTPRSGTGTQPNGAGGSGSVWGIRNGNWASTFSNGGGIIGPVVNQAPRNAEISEGTYDWAISVQAVNDTTNEVRWYLVKTDNSYWFGGSVMAPALTDKFNGIAFWFRDGAVTQFNIFDAQVDLGDPIQVPPAPFEAFYADTWGFSGGQIGGWSFKAGDVTGNAGMGGNAPNTGLAALRTGFDPLTPLAGAGNALLVTGSIEFVGGGFEAANSFRFGIFQGDSAGSVITDATPDNGDSTRWSGTARAHSGYLFVPPSGNNPPAIWAGSLSGTSGAVVKGTWYNTDGASNYVLGANLQHPSGAVPTAGTYNFKISVQPKASGANDVRFIIEKSDKSYAFYGAFEDNHAPLATNKFNSVAFALSPGNTTTALNLVDVYIDKGDPIDVPTGVQEAHSAEIPTDYVLNQNYPNPFNPTTMIEFGLPKNGEVKLTVYDLSGRVVKNLTAGNFKAGYHKIEFNASNLGSGIYYYKLTSGDFVSVKKLMLLK